MERRAWQSRVHGITKSHKQLSNWAHTQASDKMITHTLTHTGVLSHDFLLTSLHDLSKIWRKQCEYCPVALESLSMSYFTAVFAVDVMPHLLSTFQGLSPHVYLQIAFFSKIMASVQQNLLPAPWSPSCLDPIVTWCWIAATSVQKDLWMSLLLKSLVRSCFVYEHRE